MSQFEPNIREAAWIRHDDGPQIVDISGDETGWDVREGLTDIVYRENGGAGRVGEFVAEEEEFELVFWKGLTDGQVGAVEWGTGVCDDEVYG